MLMHKPVKPMKLKAAMSHMLAAAEPVTLQRLR